MVYGSSNIVINRFLHRPKLSLLPKFKQTYKLSIAIIPSIPFARKKKAPNVESKLIEHSPNAKVFKKKRLCHQLEKHKKINFNSKKQQQG